MNLQSSSSFSKIARRTYAKDYPESSVYSDYRKRLNLPLWDGGFDIVIGYGYHGQNINNVQNTDYSTFTVLDCCQITGSMVQLDYNGEPIKEVYTFIGRDTKKTKQISSSQKPESGHKTNHNSSFIALPSKVSLVASLDLSSSGRENLLIYPNSNIEFTGQAVLKFSDTFSDKRLTVPLNLTVKQRQLTYQFDKDLYKIITKEIKKKGMSNATGSLEFSYKNNSNKEQSDKATIQIPIKM